MLSAIYGDQFFKDCYIPLGDVMDAMALINSAITSFSTASCPNSFGRPLPRPLPAVKSLLLQGVSPPSWLTNVEMIPHHEDSNEPHSLSTSVTRIPLILGRSFDSKRLRNSVIKEEDNGI
ncbi:Uncharacterized protein FKW44_020974 [Caligus rogercresseyi]|uniref:Uncharacterized protein n=1 Tax=Caligus rogercresseyi TaxID=217165 RepID=A0A7T8JUZ2_CALRO|nr:Uncharacterized protein FKW44_020974 [Caligus rogercresseyi]